MTRSEILKKIAADLASGDVSFPTNATLALKLQHAFNDPDCHAESAARLIKAEPLLSAKVVALANTSAFNPAGRPISDLRLAITRLGFRALRVLASSVVAKQLAQAATGDRERRLAASLWEHTAHVAALAYVIARRLTRQDPETAMFAGMVHEIGGFYMISRAKDYPELLEDDYPSWGESGEADLGREVLRLLEVPDNVVEGIEVCWHGFLAMPPASLGDTLLLADELAPVESPFRDLDGVPRVGRSAEIGLVIGHDTLAEVLADSQAEVRSLTAALR